MTKTNTATPIRTSPALGFDDLDARERFYDARRRETLARMDFLEKDDLAPFPVALFSFLLLAALANLALLVVAFRCLLFGHAH